MPAFKHHEMLPTPRHDEQARQDFVGSRCQAHHAIAVQRPELVDEPLRQGEVHLGLERHG